MPPARVSKVPAIIKTTGKLGFEVLVELFPNTSGSFVGAGLIASFIARSISDGSSLPEIEFSGAEFAKRIVGLTVRVELGVAVGLVVGAVVGV